MRSFKCDKCEYSTKWIRHLKAHKDRHSRDEPEVMDDEPEVINDESEVSVGQIRSQYRPLPSFTTLQAILEFINSSNIEIR